ncbi:hypothetical protein GJAV_G00231330 [Gymnothorax javanicus]|nr:hypothetical protein GJAV_G00231330 [Gymnothorax javanicus]
MDLGCMRFSICAVLCFYVVFLHRGCRAQICSVPSSANVEENQPPGTHIATIDAQQNVTFELLENPGNFFKLQGADVVVNISLDYEASPPSIEIAILCSHPDQGTQRPEMVIIVLNVNDMEPVFAQSQYHLNAPELSPVDFSVGEVVATDPEGDLLFYHIDPENEYFKMRTVNSPVIVVKKPVDYDFEKNISFKLIAVDTRSPPPPNVPSFSATATVNINIKDVDNRPPWFQPCTKMTINNSTICLGSGYRGEVNLTDKTEGVLPLEPGPVFAIDGDEGRNEQIIYRIVDGNEDGIFQMDEDSGNITMLKAAGVEGPIVLTVLAIQLLNSDQFASSSVTFDVVIKSKHLPKFEKEQYEGFISSDSGPNSLVLEGKSSNRPLRVQATDSDFSNGVNPAVRYAVEGSSSFSIAVDGFVLLKGEVSEGNVSLSITAEDTTNGELGRAMLSVQVLPGATTAIPTTTMQTTAIPTSGVANVTTGFTAGSLPTTTQSQEGTADPDPEPPQKTGGYSETDMAALGASLATLLVLCLAIITLLLVRIKRGDTAWKKLAEASLFRSTLFRGSGGMKEGVQYTNSGFQNDGDTGSVSSDLTKKASLTLDMSGSEAGARDTSVTQASLVAAALHRSIQPDNSSLADSDKADSEKEVKPILTKERRNEEGYKSVWFKEDIDPNAKEEVLIIPESGEREADEDDEEEVDSVDGEDVSLPDTPSGAQQFDISGTLDSSEEGDNSDL